MCCWPWRANALLIPEVDMLPLLSASGMRAFERRSIEEWGIPSLVLQEHAAQGALALIPAGEAIFVLAGPGNNGGDALALARLAVLKGRSVEVWTLDANPKWRGDAALQARLWEGLGRGYRCTDDPRTVVATFHGWVVDGLFGLGTRLPLPALAQAWIESLNARGCSVLALDQPTGLDPSSGNVSGEVLQSRCTACFGHRKICHGLRPAKDFCGEITVLDLPLKGTPEADLMLMEAPRLKPILWNSHKRDFGHVAIRAGRLGMSGAAVLATLGALHGGAGLVTVLVDPEIRAEVAGQVPEAMVRDWTGQVPEGIDVLLVGPGGVEEVPDWSGLLVLDASALGPREGTRWMARPGTILTPHPGEFSRLFDGQDISSRTAMDRLTAIRSVSKGPGVLVLKGAQTLIGGADEEVVYLNDTGHSGLSTGGTGDFLAGLIAARVARHARTGVDAAKLKVAAAEAVWLHGAAADRLGPGPLLVRELGPALSLLLRELL